MTISNLYIYICFDLGYIKNKECVKFHSIVTNLINLLSYFLNHYLPPHFNASLIMDSRLFEAAWTGNVDELFSLLRANPLILQTSSLEGGYTPLHVAAMAGHLDFIIQILKLKPSYSTEMNTDGLTALHIVSAIGEVEVVKELLKLGGVHLCLLKGRERRIPLHYAAIKGRVQVMKELLVACPSSVEEVTVWKETAIYLAVKNNQFEAFVELVEWLRQGERQSIINWKNRQGNTVLHLAVAMKQLEVILKNCNC